MEVGAEGAEEAHGVHGPAANLCVRSGGHPIRGSGREPLEEWSGAGLAQSLQDRRGFVSSLARDQSLAFSLLSDVGVPLKSWGVLL